MQACGMTQGTELRGPSPPNLTFKVRLGAKENICSDSGHRHCCCLPCHLMNWSACQQITQRLPPGQFRGEEK